jgi:hypothetical protein
MNQIEQPEQELFNSNNLIDLNYHQLWQVWSTNKELIKWAFPIYSYTPIDGGIKYALEYDAQTTHKTIDALAKEGYRCSIVERLLKGESVGYDHGPQAETIEEALLDVSKWLNERPNRPLDLRHVAMLAYHAQQTVEHEPVAWKHDCAALLQNGIELWIDRCPHCGKPATPKQEPVKDRLDFWALIDENQRLRAELKFNTVPQPQREWVSLNDDDIWRDDRIMAENASCGLDMSRLSALVSVIEAKLRERNGWQA